MHLRRILVVAAPVLVAAAAVVVSVLLYVNFKQQQQPVWNPFPINLVLTDECAKTFLVEHKFTHLACVKETLVKAVGYGIVLLSSVLKLPMIINVVRAKSTLGLNTPSVALEAVAQALSMSASIKKHIPFGLWGEHGTIYLQNLALLLLASTYAGSSTSSNSSTSGLLMVGGVIALTLCALVLAPASAADVLLGAATLVSMSSRVPQLVANYQQKHTGVLSVVTQTLQFVGSAVRMATVFAGTKDVGTRVGSAVAVVLSASILAQVALYWQETQRRLDDTQQQHKKKAQ